MFSHLNVDLCRTESEAYQTILASPNAQLLHILVIYFFASASLEIRQGDDTKCLPTVNVGIAH